MPLESYRSVKVEVRVFIFRSIEVRGLFSKKCIKITFDHSDSHIK